MWTTGMSLRTFFFSFIWILAVRDYYAVQVVAAASSAKLDVGKSCHFNKTLGVVKFFGENRRFLTCFPQLYFILQEAAILDCY